MTDRRVKLTGGLEKTVTWIWLDPEAGGKVKIEFHDFSETTQRMFGNDIAYTLTVSKLNRLFSLTGQSDESLVQWIAENFQSYFGIKRWLDENKIEYTKDTESWA